MNRACSPSPIAASTRRGHTLVEMIVSLTMVSLLLVAMTSIVTLTMRALGNSGGPSARAVIASNTLQDISRDVSTAVDFIQYTPAGDTPTILEFTVPDRNGDLIVETIRYEWSGVAGAPLLRSYNAAAAVPVANDVRDFSLSYITRFRPKAAPPTPPPQESAEVVLMSYDATSGGTLKEKETKDSDWCAQYVKPTLPTNTNVWKITRVQLSVRRDNGASQSYDVQIRTADAALKPLPTILESNRYQTVDLSSSFRWETYPFTTVNALAPNQGVCIVLSVPMAAAKYPFVQYHDNGSGMPANTHWMTTTNSGSSWSNPDNSNDARFYVYGTYTTQGPPTW